MITRLVHACQTGDEPAVSELLSEGGGIDEFSSITYGGDRFLEEDLWREEIARLKNGGLTPLMWAAFCGHSGVIRLLLDHGAQPNLRDKVAGVPWGRTALMYGGLNGEPASLRYLLSAGADASLRDEGVPYCGAGCTALHHAVRAGRERAVSVLSEIHSILDLRNDAGETALYLAAGKGDVGIVKMLLDRGASPDRADNEVKMTPLHRACLQDHTKIVALLLDAGANPNRKAADGLTPFQMAIEGDSADIVQMLIAAGASLGGRELKLAKRAGANNSFRILNRMLKSD